MKKVNIITLLLVFIIILSLLPTTALASTTTYSNVIDDLAKADNFSEEHYPVKTDDYSLSVIQLAESKDYELFVYVYQAGGQSVDVIASSINISTSINDNIKYHNYGLQLVSSSGTLYKYLVNDFTVKADNTRYYNITSIYRPFIDGVDEQADHDNEITEINYPVKRQYCFSKINGVDYCQVLDIETITVTDKFVGFVRYADGYFLADYDACDSHFVAFSTDKDIDRLFEADVYYTHQTCRYTVVQGGGSRPKEYGNELSTEVSLTYTDKGIHESDTLFGGTYVWNRIETVDQFINENNLTQNVYTGACLSIDVASTLTDDAIEALSDMKWVLRFAETEYDMISENNKFEENKTIVGNVTILRLKFETDGVVYNLGVLDNKQSGSKDPVNNEEVVIKPSDNLLGLLKLILMMFALCVLLYILSWVLPIIINGVMWLVDLLFKPLGSTSKRSKKASKRKYKRK